MCGSSQPSAEPKRRANTTIFWARDPWALVTGRQGTPKRDVEKETFKEHTTSGYQENVTPKRHPGTWNVHQITRRLAVMDPCETPVSAMAAGALLVSVMALKILQNIHKRF